MQSQREPQVDVGARVAFFLIFAGGFLLLTASIPLNEMTPYLWLFAAVLLAAAAVFGVSIFSAALLALVPIAVGNRRGRKKPQG